MFLPEFAMCLLIEYQNYYLEKQQRLSQVVFVATNGYTSFAWPLVEGVE